MPYIRSILIYPLYDLYMAYIPPIYELYTTYIHLQVRTVPMTVHVHAICDLYMQSGGTSAGTNCIKMVA